MTVVMQHPESPLCCRGGDEGVGLCASQRQLLHAVIALFTLIGDGYPPAIAASGIRSDSAARRTLRSKEANSPLVREAVARQ